MSKKRETDARATKAVVGLAVFVAGVAGIGWWRSRATREPTPPPPCKVVEESVYRGFEYRIEECPSDSGPVYRSIVPAQQFGTIQAVAEESDLLATIELARRHAQMLIDAKFGPQQRAIFVGTNR